MHKRVDGRTWDAFARPAKKLRPGDEVTFGAQLHRGVLSATVVARGEGGVCVRLQRGVSDDRISLLRVRDPLRDHVQVLRHVALPHDCRFRLEAHLQQRRQQQQQ